MIRLIASLFAMIFLTSCGYHFEGGEKIAVSVPYVIGDHEGELTKALIWALSRTSQFRYDQDEGDWILKAKVVSTVNDRIGYRYDRRDKSGKLRDNIIGIENRKIVGVEISVEDAVTGKKIVAPQVIKADATYDYVDPNSLQDVSFVDEQGVRQTTIAFSLGQLDSVAAAGEDAIYPLYHSLAQKVVEGLLASGEEDGE